MREVVFINPDTESGYGGLPVSVGELADGAVTLLQNGKVSTPKGQLSRTLKGKLRGNR